MSNINYRYKQKVACELKRLIQKPEVSIEDFCIRCNEWLLHNGFKPVKGTPFRDERTGAILQFVRAKSWKLERVRK